MPVFMPWEDAAAHGVFSEPEAGGAVKVLFLAPETYV